MLAEHYHCWVRVGSTHHRPLSPGVSCLMFPEYRQTTDFLLSRLLYCFLAAFVCAPECTRPCSWMTNSTVHKRIKNVNNHESLYFLDQNLILWVRKPVSPKSEQSQGRNLPRLLLALSESKSPWIFPILLFADFWLAERLSSGLWLADVWQLRFISSYQNFRLGDFISPPICWRTLQSANERALLFLRLYLRGK